MREQQWSRLAVALEEQKLVLTAIQAGDKTAATAAYRAAQPVLDTMVTKGIIHRNKAARHKRELNARLKAMAA